MEHFIGIGLKGVVLSWLFALMGLPCFVPPFASESGELVGGLREMMGALARLAARAVAGCFARSAAVGEGLSAAWRQARISAVPSAKPSRQASRVGGYPCVGLAPRHFGILRAAMALGVKAMRRGGSWFGLG